jgi:cation transport ATPase
MVTAVSMHKLARSGILVRSADLLHRTQRVSVVAFDKTGTLSRGCFTVVRSEILVKGAEPVIYGLVKDSDHPIAQGVRRFLNHRSDGMVPGNISELSTVPGKGIRAALCGFELLGGSPSFSGIDSHATVREYVSSGLSLFTVTLGGTCLAAFGLSDLPRPEARSLVRSLQRMGKKVIILSGDNRAAVSRFAADVDVDVANVHASCSPKDKQDFIRSLQARHETVLFVGDGTNDGPALATADASLAVVSGSDVAHTSASAILLGPNIHQGIVLLLRVARAADLRTRMSLLWCAAYMVGAMVLASGAAVRFRIEPRWAGLGEVVSVLPVVLIGLSMRWVVLTGAGTHLN